MCIRDRNKAVVVDGNLDASSFRNLTASGAITSASFVTTGNAITIADNEITTGSSNADINITPHGTGKVVIKSLDVNEITSTDSSAIQIVDALNVSGRVTSGTGFTGDVTGNASTATTLATARNITIAGDVDASATAFDGSGNITLNLSLIHISEPTRPY